MADVTFSGFESIDMLKARFGWKPSDDALKFHEPTREGKAYWVSIERPDGSDFYTAAVTTKMGIKEIKEIYNNAETKNRVGIGMVDYGDGSQPVPTLYVRGELKTIDSM